MEQTLKDLITLFGFSEQDPLTLQEHFHQTSKWSDEVVKVFYDILFSYERTTQIFKENERSAREKTLRDWYLNVADGKITPEWWRRQWVVGLVHIPRKVSNPFMLGKMSRLQQFFLKKCLEEMPLAEAEKVFGAFKRITDIVAGLIAEGCFANYIVAMERSAGFKKALVERMMNVEIGKMLEEVRAGYS